MISKADHRSGSWRWAIGLAMLLAICLGNISLAQTRPAAQQEIYKDTPLRRAPAANETAETSGQPAASSSSGFGVTRIALSLGLVLFLIFMLRFVGQRWFTPGGAKAASRTIEPVSRTLIGPKQQVLLIRVGRRRMLVVGDSGGKLSSLDQITDVDEIAELLGQIQSEKSSLGVHAFAGLFNRNSDKFAAAQSDGESEPVEEKADADEGDAEIVDRSVSSTRRDLERLLVKVRGLSNRMQ